MPLAELLVAPPPGAAAAASGGAKRPGPPRAPQAQDVCTLLTRVLLAVQQGAPLCLDTVKQAWRELSFSHVFEVRVLCACWLSPAAAALLLLDSLSAGFVRTMPSIA